MQKWSGDYTLQDLFDPLKQNDTLCNTPSLLGRKFGNGMFYSCAFIFVLIFVVDCA